LVRGTFQFLLSSDPPVKSLYRRGYPRTSDRSRLRESVRTDEAQPREAVEVARAHDGHVTRSRLALGVSRQAARPRFSDQGARLTGPLRTHRYYGTGQRRHTSKLLQIIPDPLGPVR
jgi:hypothetical protein